MNIHATQKTELNKILALAAEFATLEGGKDICQRTFGIRQ